MMLLVLRAACTGASLFGAGGSTAGARLLVMVVAAYRHTEVALLLMVSAGDGGAGVGAGAGAVWVMLHRAWRMLVARTTSSMRRYRSLTMTAGGPVAMMVFAVASRISLSWETGSRCRHPRSWSVARACRCLRESSVRGRG